MSLVPGWVCVDDNNKSRGMDSFETGCLIIIAYIVMLIAIRFCRVDEFLWHIIKYVYSFAWIKLRWSESAKIILINIFLLTAIPLFFIGLMIFKFFSRFIYTYFMILIDFLLAGFLMYLNFCSAILCYIFAITIGALIYYFVFVKLFPRLIEGFFSLFDKCFNTDIGYEILRFFDDDNSWRVIWSIILIVYVIPIFIILLW